jgi:hypothetical protein
MASQTYDVVSCGGAERGVAWASSDTAVLRVDGAGQVAARAPGRAVVTARLRGEVATRPVEVTPPVGSFAWEPRAATVRVGDTLRLRAVLRDSAGRAVGGYGPSFVLGGADFGSADVLWHDTVATVVGRQPGRAVIGAQLGPRVDTAVVTVVPRGP